MAVPKRALLVDDEPHVRTYIKLILGSLGVEEIVEAANGKEGVEKFQQVRPDVVVMDVNMPEMDGLAALAEIQAIDEDAAVIMMTSLASRDTVERAAKTGAVEYIRKDLPRSEVTRIFTETFDEIFE